MLGSVAVRRFGLTSVAVAVGAVALLATPASPRATASARLGLAEAHAQTPAAPPAEDRVVLRVGESTLTVSQVEARLARTPTPQLRALGEDAASIRRAFVERVLAPELMAAEEARARKMHERPDVADRIRAVHRLAILDDLKKGLGIEKGVSDEEVKAYYQANADKFLSPKRVALWRILVATEADARAVLAEMNAGDGASKPDPKKWADLARERSLDQATKLRGGNLGFAGPDGATTDPSLQVDPALLTAVEKIEDGAILPEPVREGERWAVVWKRQTMRAVERPLELEAPQIRAALSDQKLRGAVEALIAGLRKDLVTEQSAELVDMVVITAEGEIERARRPGVLPRAKRQARPAPAEGPAGLR